MTRTEIEEPCEGTTVDRKRRAKFILEFETQSVAMTREVNDLGLVFQKGSSQIVVGDRPFGDEPEFVTLLTAF